MASAGSAVPAISVIIPVRNEEKHLGQVLEDLSNQTLAKDRFEVIVVDGLSGDRTVAVARDYAGRFPMFQIRENPRRLSSAARNIGITVSQGDYLVFIDGHCRLPSQELLEDLVRLFERHDADVLCRPAPPVEPMTKFQQAVAAARKSSVGHGLDSTIYSQSEGWVPAASSGAAYRRRVFEQLGSFDESFDACEDVEFNTRVDRAGLKAFTSPKMNISYVIRASLPALWHQLFRYGVGRWKLLVKHPVSASPGTFVPPLLALSVPLLIFWWLVSSPLALAVAGLIALYLLVVLASSITTAIKEDICLLPFLPVILVTIHMALGFGFLLGPLLSLRRWLTIR